MRRRLIVLLVVAAFLLSTMPALADAGFITTAFAVQNLGDGDTDVTVEFRNTGGTLTNLLEQEIDSGASYNFDQRYQTGDPGDDPFQGSAIVASSEQPIGAVANLMRTGGDVPAYESYNGLSQAEVGTEIALPQVLKQILSLGIYWNTTIVIQNTDTENAIDVDVVFVPKLGAVPPAITTPYTKSIAIAGGGTYYMDQKNEPTDGQIGTSFFGSARVKSDTAVAVAVYCDGGEQVLLSFPAYTEGTTDPVLLPSMYKYVQSLGDSYSTAMLVANMGDADAVIEIQYIPGGAGTVVGTEVYTIPMGGATNIDQRYEASITSGTFMGSAIVTPTNDVPIVINANMRGGTRYGMTYRGMWEGGEPAYLPITYNAISSGGFVWDSTMIVCNLGDDDATAVDFTFYPQAGGEVADPGYAVAENMCQQFDLRYSTATTTMPTFIGSVKVEADQPIAAMVQTRGAGGSGDALMAYLGLMTGTE